MFLNAIAPVPAGPAATGKTAALPGSTDLGEAADDTLPEGEAAFSDALAEGEKPAPPLTPDASGQARRADAVVVVPSGDVVIAEPSATPEPEKTPDLSVAISQSPTVSAEKTNLTAEPAQIAAKADGQGEVPRQPRPQPSQIPLRPAGPTPNAVSVVQASPPDPKTSPSKSDVFVAADEPSLEVRAATPSATPQGQSRGSVPSFADAAKPGLLVQDPAPRATPASTDSEAPIAPETPRQSVVTGPANQTQPLPGTNPAASSKTPDVESVPMPLEIAKGLKPEPQGTASFPRAFADAPELQGQPLSNIKSDRPALGAEPITRPIAGDGLAVRTPPPANAPAPQTLDTAPRVEPSAQTPAQPPAPQPTAPPQTSLASAGFAVVSDGRALGKDADAGRRETVPSRIEPQNQAKLDAPTTFPASNAPRSGPTVPHAQPLDPATQPIPDDIPVETAVDGELTRADVTGRDPVTSQPIAQGRVEYARPQMVMAQLTEAAKTLREGQVEVTLVPEELGRVRLTMSPSEAGMAVTIMAERPETLELMRRNIELLARDLSDQGFVNLSFQFGGSNPENPGSESGPFAEPAPARDWAERPIEIPQTLSGVAPSGGLDLRL